jgi:choline-glycine betaine transporter
VLAALPFTFILYGMIFVTLKELRADRKAMLTALYRRHSDTPVGADAFEAEELAEEDRYRRAPDIKNRRINPR